MSRYATARSFWQALTDRARISSKDPSKVIQDFLAERLLDRIFSVSPPLFLLKGGRSLLARSKNARRTKDTDLLFREKDIDRSIEALRDLASLDRGDHLSFRMTKLTDIAAAQEYRQGKRVSFDVRLDGTKRVGLLNIDVVVDTAADDEYEMIRPDSSLSISGIEAPIFYVVPKEHSIADKACITMELHNGRESSRVRDLVDIVFYALTQSIRGNKLEQYLSIERRLRGIPLMEEFNIPSSWLQNQQMRYRTAYETTDLPNEYSSIETAFSLAKLLLDPALRHEVSNSVWNPELLIWASETESQIPPSEVNQASS